MRHKIYAQMKILHKQTYTYLISGTRSSKLEVLSGELGGSFEGDPPFTPKTKEFFIFFKC